MTTHRVVSFLLRFYLLDVIRWKPLLPLATVIPFPPTAILLAHLSDDGMFAERKLVLVARLIVV